MIPHLANVIVSPASATVTSSLRIGAWSDVIWIDGRLWFLGDPAIGETMGERPRITRIPLSELSG